MSAVSEFRRLVGGCTDLLETCDAAAAARLTSSLLGARAIAASDLSEAAARVLALEEAAPSAAEIGFRNPVDRDTFAERFDSVLAISRALLGRTRDA